MSQSQDKLARLGMVALYVAGSTDAAETAMVEDWLTSGDSDITSEFVSFGGVIEALVEESVPVTPPAAILDSILTQLPQQAPQSPSNKGVGEAYSENKPFIQRDGAMAWKDWVLPGSKFRQLFIDKSRGIQTFMVRLTPGTVIPPHDHHAPEECFVIDGDLFSLGRKLEAGDYVRHPAGLSHSASHTVSGCTLLVTAGVDEHAEA